MASGDEHLLKVLLSWRLAFDVEHPNMSPTEREERFQEIWNNISARVTCNPASASLHETLVPQKRSASCTALVGLEPNPKRAVPASTSASVHQPERHTPASAGMTPSPSSRSATSPAGSAKTKPINIPRQTNKSGRRQSTSNASQATRSVQPRPLHAINEVQDMSPTDYLAQSPDRGAQPTPGTFCFTAPEPGRGEWHAPDMSQLTVQPFGVAGSYSPVHAASDSCLASTSAAFSAPMTRTNTNDQICEPFVMFHMDPTAAGMPDESMSKGMQHSLSVVPSVDSTAFPFSHMIPGYHQSVSLLPVAMKPSLSQESVSSSSSDSVSFLSVSSTSASQPHAQGKPRTLAPKKQDDVSNQMLVPKLVAVKGADGTVKHKAEIARTIRPPQQRKTTFCDFCNDQPQGFHGDHELRRHIERQHTQWRKVWICRDISEGGTFLRNCKACRNQKTYGANYNAAAHLRRTHFNPCKNKRGGRGKKSEGRGGMGGGNSPSMEELKKWMYETYEVNLNGRVIVQNVAPDANVPQVPMIELTGFDQSGSSMDGFEIDYETAIADESRFYGGVFPNDGACHTQIMHAYPPMQPLGHAGAAPNMPMSMAHHDGPQYIHAMGM